MLEDRFLDALNVVDNPVGERNSHWFALLSIWLKGAHPTGKMQMS